MIVHMRLRSAKMLAFSVANGASEVFRIEVSVVVVLAHVSLVVALKPECLKQEQTKC